MQGKTIEILKEAMKGGYAVGAFNTANLEISQAIVSAAHELEKACIIQATPNAFKYANSKTLSEVIQSVIKFESNSTVVGFHLDHGKNLDHIIEAIDAGVDSVMIDGSILSFKENVELTSRVVEYAHERGIAVQAELGAVPYVGREQQNVDWEEIMTNPDQAEKLVKKTGVDALAVGIGNAHGFFREPEVPDWGRLKKIRELLPDTLLIMHGASDWGEGKIKKAIEGGVCCFNIDTDIRIAFMTVLCNRLSQKCDTTDPRKILGPAREAVKEKVEEKIRLFANEN